MKIENIRRDHSLVDAALRFGVELKKSGSEYEACCPFHNEKTPSFTIYPGRDGVWRFQCFGCDARGDVIDFVSAIKGVDAREARAILAGGSSAPNVAPKTLARARDVYEGITLLAPPPMPAGRLSVYNPKREHWGEFTPSRIFAYPGVGYVVRRDMSNGDKETPMVCWCCLPDGKEGWCRYPFPTPRPLYRAERLRDGQVFVVEGEKCADAMARATGRNVVSWVGGTHGINHADWSALAGRQVIVWPDADGPGLATAGRISDILEGMGCTVRVLDVMSAAA